MGKYSKPAIALHWLIALLIIIAFAIGTIVSDMHGISPTKLKLVSWHKWLGVTVLSLAALRLVWRLLRRPPPLPLSMPAWQRMGAHVLHGLLYVLMFAVPLSGYFYTLAAGVPVVLYGVIPLPVLIDPDPHLKHQLHDLHEMLTNVLLAAFILHVAAALKHHFIDRDDVLKRMLP
jgi:cytochrome b561